MNEWPAEVPAHIRRKFEANRAAGVPFTAHFTAPDGRELVVTNDPTCPDFRASRAVKWTQLVEGAEQVAATIAAIKGETVNAPQAQIYAEIERAAKTKGITVAEFCRTPEGRAKYETYRQAAPDRVAGAKPGTVKAEPTTGYHTQGVPGAATAHVEKLVASFTAKGMSRPDAMSKVAREYRQTYEAYRTETAVKV